MSPLENEAPQHEIHVQDKFEIQKVTIDETSTDEKPGLTSLLDDWDFESNSEQTLEHLRKILLLHLVVSLHSYGDTTHRTEYLASAVAESLNIRADVGAFPNFVLVSFLSKDSDPSKSELHNLPVTGGLDLDKLGRTDQLCQVNKEACLLVVTVV